MTNAPSDLLAFRARVQALTGIRSAADVGIVGDGAHQKTGGYHEGKDVLTSIGAYHPSASAGSTREDYSARTARDRAGLTNSSSGMDITASWPNGGTAAWRRFCTELLAELRAGRADLAAVRGINADAGSGMHRYDREYGWASQSTSDAGHIHIEWYRDTEGKRQACLDRLAVLITAAVNNTSPEDDDMADSVLDWNTAWRLQGINNEDDPIVVPANAAIGASGFEEANLPLQRAKRLEAALQAAGKPGAPTQEQVNAAVAGIVDQLADAVADKLAARLQA